MNRLVFGQKRQLWIEVRPRDDIRVDTEPAAEHATLASWRLGLGGQVLTVGRSLDGSEAFEEVEDVPLIDLAVWLADSWAALMFDPEAPAQLRRSRDSVLAQDVAEGFEKLAATQREKLRQWAMSHSLSWAATDYAVPNVLLARCDAGIEVSWCPQEAKSESLFDVVFDPPAGAGIVTVRSYTALVSDLCAWVAERCHQDGVRDVRLRRIEQWQNRDRSVAMVFAGEWLERRIAGGVDWLRRHAPAALAELAAFGDSAHPELAFLRTAGGLRSTSDLDTVWTRLRDSVGATAAAPALAQLQASIAVELDPRQPWNSGYALAKQVRPGLQAMLGISTERNNPLDVPGLFEHLGLPIVDATDLPPTIQGAAILDARGRGAVLVNRASTFGASHSGRRAILAHELCHLLFDRTASGQLGQLDLRRDLTRDMRLEQRANAFAAEILLPRKEILRHSARGKIARRELERLAREYGAGMELAGFQAENAKILVV